MFHHYVHLQYYQPCTYILYHDDVLSGVERYWDYIFQGAFPGSRPSAGVHCNPGLDESLS